MLLFEVLLGASDFFAHLGFESTSKQRFEQPPQRRGELELERADEVRAVLDLVLIDWVLIDRVLINWVAFEARPESRHGVREPVGG